MTPTRSPASLYTRWLSDLWNGALDDVAAAAVDLVRPDFVGHWPGQPALVHGPDALAGVVRQGRLPFSPLRFDVEIGPITDGALVAARWVGHGAYAGGEHAVPGATAHPGTRVEFRGHDILRVEGHQFAEYWVLSEGEHLMAQLSTTS